MKTREFLDMLCEALNRPPGSIRLEDGPQTVQEWDSLGYLAIIGLVDSLFPTAFADRSFQEFRTVQELVENLCQRGFLKDDAP